VSADLDELLELADRIGLMLAGRLVAHVNAHEADAASIGRCMTGLLGTAPVAALIRP
jgi:ABC-type uncharacterized transport system ATPase subunit